MLMKGNVMNVQSVCSCPKGVVQYYDFNFHLIFFFRYREHNQTKNSRHISYIDRLVRLTCQKSTLLQHYFNLKPQKEAPPDK